MRHAWLLVLVAYAVAGLADMSWRLIDDLTAGDQKIELSELDVAFSAGLFWPVDLVATALLAAR